jgi:hypothetical protein
MKAKLNNLTHQMNDLLAKLWHKQRVAQPHAKNGIFACGHLYRLHARINSAKKITKQPKPYPAVIIGQIRAARCRSAGSAAPTTLSCHRRHIRQVKKI